MVQNAGDLYGNVMFELMPLREICKIMLRD
jgi:hypothetical protein